jgi:hypothetical protein
MATMTKAPKLSTVVSHYEWIEARKQFLAKEKEFTRLRDELSRQRRELPWEKIEKDDVFEGPRGKETLGDLFDSRTTAGPWAPVVRSGWQPVDQELGVTAGGDQDAAGLDFEDDGHDHGAAAGGFLNEAL